MTFNPPHGLGSGDLAGLLNCSPSLFDITLDQLRTLIATHEAGSALAASRLLDREHSSVRKQVDTLNHSFRQMCGETLVVKQGRGQDYLFTPTGDVMVRVASDMFATWLAAIAERRRRLGATLTIATTEFTVDFLAEIWPSVTDEFVRREIELNIVHVRTRDFRAMLDAKEVDLVCGSVPADPRPDPALPGYDVIEWQREKLVLITNLSDRELPVPVVNQERLPTVPLLAPIAGLIADFLRRWYGSGFRSQLHVVADIDSIYYGLAVMRTNLVHGAMICTQAAAQAALDGRLPGSPGFRVVPLATDYDPPLELVAGVFARKGERGLYDTSHPLNLVWEAFKTHAPATSNVDS